MQAEEAQVVNESSAPIAYVSVPRGEIIRIVITGLLAGLLIPLLTTLLTTYFINPVFCQAGESDICASGSVIANHISAVIMGVAVFVVLTRWAVYRALLLVAASTLAMWGLQKYAADLTTQGFEYYLFSMLLYGMAYLAFYWLLRLRSFVASLVLTIALTVAACVVLVVTA